MREEVATRVGMRGGASWKNGHGIEAGLLEYGRITSIVTRGSLLTRLISLGEDNGVIHCAGMQSANNLFVLRNLYVHNDEETQISHYAACVS